MYELISIYIFTYQLHLWYNLLSVIKKDLFTLVISIFLYIFSLVFIILTLYPIHFVSHPFFISELISYPFTLPAWSIYFFGGLNIIVLYLISRQISNNYSYLPALIYGLSPWFAYSAAANSFYIFLLFLILIWFLGLLSIRQKNIFGRILFILSSITLIYSSAILFLLSPLLIALLIYSKFILWSDIKKTTLKLAILAIPLILASFLNITGIKNIYTNQIKFLSDPGIINSSNVFQSQARTRGYIFLAKVSQNKYLYSSKYLLNKLIKNVTPSTYFTPQEKLLGFSFTPPIFVGFLIPFLVGLFFCLKDPVLRKYLLLSSVLTLPSFFSQQPADLNRLLIFSPILIFLICFGLTLLLNKKIRFHRYLITLCLALVIIQLFVSIFDISHREFPRYQRYKGNNFEIAKQ